MRSHLGKVFLTLLVLSFASGESLAQRTTATFAGIVEDPTGALLPGASVQLVNEGTSATMETLTNETGEFIFDFVPVGSYTFRITMEGFRSFESRGIQLGAAQVARRTYTLEIGNVTDSVTVTGEAPLVNTMSPEQRLALDTLQVETLPMANRNITEVIEYSGAGLTKGEAIFAGAGGVRYRLNGLGGAGMSASANGTDANGNSQSLNLGAYGGFSKIDIMSAEAIGEVQVVKGVIPAEHGNALGGHLSVITKSGTNEWHGSLFHRYEGSALSAREPLLTREPNSVWNQFGGSIGGPIVRDRAFFFFAYEGYRQRSSTALQNTVPTQRLRDIMRASLPFPETDTVLDFYTLPNQPHDPDDLAAQWIGPGIDQNDDDHFDAKVDYLVVGGNLSVTFAGGHPSQRQAAQMPLNPRSFNTRSLRANASYVYSWGTWTSETRVGFTQQKGQRIEDFWFAKDPNSPELVKGWRGVPAIEFNFLGITNLNQRENREWGLRPSYSIEQQFATFRGAHSIKFGGQLNLRRGGLIDVTNSGVEFASVDDIINNTPDGITKDTGQPESNWSMPGFGLFVQDDWRVSRKLVLNLGLRYDYFGAFSATERFDNQQTPAGLYNLDGLIDPVNFVWGAARDLDQPWEDDGLNIAPRFGFAYTADDAGDFVVRGGFGINFSGFDPGHVTPRIQRFEGLPFEVEFSRAEAAALGLKYPAYNADLAELVLSQNRPVQPNTRLDPDLESPYAMNYSLGIQMALTPTMVLETSYVGTRGVKFFLTRRFNLVDRLTGIRPNPDDIQGRYIDNSEQTNYNSWQTSLRKRVSNGLAFNVNYTWGKALSYAGGDISPGFMGDSRDIREDFNNIKIERSPSSGDITHLATVDWVYAVPTLLTNSAFGRQVLGGWQVSGIFKARTGLPLGVSQSGGRPDIIDIENAVNTECCSFGNLQYLNPDAFQTIQRVRASGRTFRPGFATAAPLRGPGAWNLDLSIGKSFSIAEETRLEFQADMLNAFNHTQYTGVSTNASRGNFGQITGTASPRVVQLELRLAF